jgi:hypothetical protein
LFAIATTDYKRIKHYLLESSIQFQYWTVLSTIQLDLSFGAKIKSKSIKKISKRKYFKAKWKQFYKNLNLINNNNYNDLNLIKFYESFKLDINNEIEKNLPMCSYNNDGSKNKLLPQHIIDMIKTKNKCKSNFKRYGNQIDQNIQLMNQKLIFLLIN